MQPIAFQYHEAEDIYLSLRNSRENLQERITSWENVIGGGDVKKSMLSTYRYELKCVGKCLEHFERVGIPPF